MGETISGARAAVPGTTAGPAVVPAVIPSATRDVLLVHTPALRSFARALGSGAGGTLGPNDVRVMFANGAVFGAGHPSADVVAAIDTYVGCLGAMTGQLVAHVHAATILASAGERIASEYAAADTASIGTVTAALTGAVAAVDVPGQLFRSVLRDGTAPD